MKISVVTMSGITAVIVFDPLARAVRRLDENSDPQESLPSISHEDAEADAKLLYYYPADSSRVEDRRNQSNLIQGVLEFAKYCRNDPKIPTQTFLKYRRPNY